MQQSPPQPSSPASPSPAPAWPPPVATPTEVEVDLVAKCKLEEVRSASRAAAQAMYEAGPGCKRPRDVWELPEEHPVRKRARKTESAYVSRYNAKVYTELLLAHLAAAEKDVVELRERRVVLEEENKGMLWNNVFNENKLLKMQIAELMQRRPTPVSAQPSEAAGDAGVPENDAEQSFRGGDNEQPLQLQPNVMNQVDYASSQTHAPSSSEESVEEKSSKGDGGKELPGSPTSERGTSGDASDLIDVGSFVSEDEVVHSLVW